MNLKALFEPESLAVVGVSSHNELHPANVIYYKNLLRYPVETYAVNPKAGLFKGQMAYASILDLPHKVDLAVIASRAERVPSILEECIRVGVGGAAIISGGFAEVGATGLQERIVAMAREADFPFIGPNCLGIYSPGHVDTFFFPTERMVTPQKGNVALISQSGGVLVDQMIRFLGEGVGMSLGLSIGNKALIREIHLLDYLEHDPETRVISFYVEGFTEKEGREFLEASRRCNKPIIVLKSGKTPGGSRAVSSHTASLAGDYKVFSSVLSQYGIVEARSLAELLYFSEALSNHPRSIPGRVGIITGSGGHGALATDLCSLYGLSVPDLGSSDQERVRSQLSPTVKSIATCSNPIDLTGSSTDEDFIQAATELAMMEDIDCLIMLLLPYFPGISPDLGGMLARVQTKVGKPMVAYIPRLEKYRMLIEGFEINGVPVAHSIEGAVHMAQALKLYRKGTAVASASIPT